MYPNTRAPVLILKGDAQRESGRKVQLSNVQAGKIDPWTKKYAENDLDQMGGVQLTSDGHAILREIDVTHPAAKNMIELSRTQDEEVGDGTTSVIVLAGEMLTVAEPLLQKNIHPTRIVKGFFAALDDAVSIMGEKLTTKIDVKNDNAIAEIVNACLATKFTSRFSKQMINLAISAVKTVHDEKTNDIDLKRYARVEKIPGGSFGDSKIVRGVVLNKDVLHPKMRRRIENPRIILLDANLEFKKGESMTSVEVTENTSFERLLEIEEEYVKKLCDDIIKFKPDIVVTEKGVTDLAAFYLAKHNITALRRLRKTDNNRLARATGATIVHRTEEIKESDVGVGCGLFDVRKIGDEYFAFFEECKNPRACTIMLRGGSKDVLNEIERNLQDAMAVARTIFTDPRIVPGGGAIEMSLAQELLEKSKSIKGVEQLAYQAVAVALEVIPRTLMDNCGAKTIRVLTELRALHAKGKNQTMGVDGIKGSLVDMHELKIWEPYLVKVQTIKTAIESACMLLRIDDIVSGLSKKKDKKEQGGAELEDPID